jgi:hypothetical protein
MLRLRWFLVVFLGSLAVLTTIEADTVRLKNGNMLSGTVVEETPDGEVTVDISGVGKLTVSKNEIMSIERASSGSTPPLNPASSDTIPQGDETNAAFWYQQAFSKIQEPSPKIQAELTEVLAKGWDGEHPALTEFLQQNAAALASLTRGAELPQCDFFNGQRPRTLSAPVPNVLKVRALAQAMTLQGRFDEHLGQTSKALERYLLTVRFGRHLCQQPQATLIDVMLGIAVQGIIYDSFAQFTQRSSLTVEDYRKAIQQMLPLMTEERELDQVVETEFQNMRGTLAEAFQKEMKNGKVDATRVGEILRAIDALHKEYEGYFSEAHRRYAPEEFMQKFQTLKQEVERDPALAKFGPVDDVLLEVILKENVVSSEGISADLIAKMFLSLSLPSMEKAMESFWIGRARFNLLVGVLGIQLYKLEHGIAPQKLDELISVHLPQVPDDPFDGMPLRYVQESGQWRLWSIGPDRKDQQGKQLLPVTLKGPGDMVLSSSP